MAIINAFCVKDVEDYVNSIADYHPQPARMLWKSIDKAADQMIQHIQNNESTTEVECDFSKDIHDHMELILRELKENCMSDPDDPVLDMKTKKLLPQKAVDLLALEIVKQYMGYFDKLLSYNKPIRIWVDFTGRQISTVMIVAVKAAIATDLRYQDNVLLEIV